jgi:CO/xanthine dehydrogenase FAD-binding subunit
MVLPLLLAGAVITTGGLQGIRRYPIQDIFKDRLLLPKGEFILGASVARKFAEAPYFHIKKTKNEKIDYPLITTAALVLEGRLRMAFSGLASYPFRDKNVEEVLNDRSLSFEERANRASRALEGVVMNDTNGSAGYRRFVLRNTIVNILESVKEAGIPCLY